MALETARHKIFVNALAPGVTDTDLVLGLAPDQQKKLLSMVPLERMATADEVALMASWIVREVHYSTGNVFHINGGVAMG